MRHLVSLLLCAAALIAGEQTGRRAPGFALPDVNMKLYDLADSGGKVVILEFTQTDCAHCATFAPVLNQVQQKYGAKVAILAVANSPHDNANTVGQYVSSHIADAQTKDQQRQRQKIEVRRMRQGHGNKEGWAKAARTLSAGNSPPPTHVGVWQIGRASCR